MKVYLAISAVMAGLLLTFSLGFCARKETMKDLNQYPFVTSVADVEKLFPKSVDQINEWADTHVHDIHDAVDAIIAIPADQRTFDNTARALDTITNFSPFMIRYNGIELVQYVYPQKEMRDAAQQAAIKLKNIMIDLFSTNKALYAAFKEYVDGPMRNESLNDEQRYYIEESMSDFKRAGLHLPDDQLDKVKKLKKELMALGQEFEKNIADDAGKRHIAVQKDVLTGLDESFINALKKDDDGLYILGVDYPTYTQVMQNCTVEQTRKDLYREFNLRGYPENETILKQIIAKRDALAHLLGFESYAAFDIDNQMAGSIDTVRNFLDSLLPRLQTKVVKEFETFTKQLPEGISLDADDKIKPWDFGFITTEYKKRNYALDERKIAEYFPMDHTIEQLLDIYRQFLGVEFKTVSNGDFWHEDVKLVLVSDRNSGQTLGYLLLDLHPRLGKYSHAAHSTMFPTIKNDNGGQTPEVSLVMANFPKATGDKPALLMRNDVSTFFHEFGHAIHALLGATQLASFSGTSVKRDFVEMPSQMLEEWMFDKGIIKKVTKHYQTGESLPDETIDTIIELKNMAVGFMYQRQILLANLALAYFDNGAHKDPYAIQKQLFQDMITHTALDPEYRMYTAFGHLNGYAAKYYGYSWSKVFALDMFAEIEKHGLLNPEIGQKYVQTILSKGGSKDPNELLKDFLGRAPDDKAFLRNLGLN